MKLAALFRAARARATCPAFRFVDTGQHQDPELSGSFFRELGLPDPDVVLGVGSGTHGAQTARIIERYERHLLGLSDPPRAVVVVGDVNSTLGCALAAVKLAIPVLHIEAGLRSFDRSMPEEINRILTDTVSSLLFASEESGAANLRHEGIDPSRVHLVGSLTVDTLLHELDRARASNLPLEHGLEPRRYVLATLHRPENVDDPTRLGRIVDALERIAKRWPIVLPLHPRTRAALEEQQLSHRLGGVKLLPPQPYRAAIGLMADAGVVITDSGGIQEETSQLGVPCLTLRKSTERPSTTTLGTNVLVPDPQELITRTEQAFERERRPAAIPGWDGRAAARTVQAICEVYA